MSRVVCLVLALVAACGSIALAAPETPRDGEAKLRKGVCGDFEWTLDIETGIISVFKDGFSSSQKYTISQCNVSQEDARYASYLVIESSCEADVSIGDEVLLPSDAPIRTINVFGCLKSIGKHAFGWSDVRSVFYEGLSSPSCDEAFISTELSRVCVSDSYPSSSFCGKIADRDCVEPGSGSDGSYPYYPYYYDYLRGSCGDFDYMLNFQTGVMSVFRDRINISESYSIRKCDIGQYNAVYVRSLEIHSVCVTDVSIEDEALMLPNASIRSITIYGCLKSIGRHALGYGYLESVYYEGISAPSCKEAFISSELDSVCVTDTYPSSSFCEKRVDLDCAEPGLYSDSSNWYYRQGRCGDFDYLIDLYSYGPMKIYRKNFTSGVEYTISRCDLDLYDEYFATTIVIESSCDADVSIADYALAIASTSHIVINGCIKSIGQHALGLYYLEDVEYNGYVAPSCKKVFSDLYLDYPMVCVNESYPSYTFCEKRAIKDCDESYSEDSSTERHGYCGDFEWTLDPQTGVMILSRDRFAPQSEYVIGECDIYWRDIEYVEELVIESTCDAKVRIEANALNFNGLRNLTIYGCLESIGDYALGSIRLDYVSYEGNTVPSCEFAFSGWYLYQVCVSDDYPASTFCEMRATAGCEFSSDSDSGEESIVSVNIPCASHVKVYSGKVLYGEYFALLDANKRLMCVNAHTLGGNFLLRCDLKDEYDRCTYVRFDYYCESYHLESYRVDDLLFLLPFEVLYDRGPFVKSCPDGHGVCDEYCGRSSCYYVNASGFLSGSNEKYEGSFTYEWLSDEPSVEVFTAQECEYVRYEPPVSVCPRHMSLSSLDTSSATKTSVQVLLAILLLVLF